MTYPWQDKQWQQCLQAMRQQRLHHALLLTGQSGLGKLSFAKQLAAILLCETAADQACGQCRSCDLMQAGSHPDYYLYQPDEGSRVIKVDQVRGLIDKVSNTPQRGQHQVVIIEPAEAMNRAAANALLKTLEEPSGQVQLILVAHRTLTIPATIVSRCLKLHFAVEDEQAAKRWLTQEVEATAELDLAWRLSCAAPMRAIAVIRDGVVEFRNTLLNHLGLVYQSGRDPIDAIDPLLKSDMLLLMQLLLSIVNDCLARQLSVSAERLMHQDQVAKIDYLSRRLPVEGLLNFQQSVLDKMHLWQTAQSVNPQLLLENLLLQWYEVGNAG